MFHTGHKPQSPGSKSCMYLTCPPSQPPPGADFLGIYTTSPDIFFSMTFAPNITCEKLNAEGVK